MKKHQVDILITREDVHSRIKEVGCEITQFYQLKSKKSDKRIKFTDKIMLK